ncbi:YbaB/EbfC family nucleoid-associated protein [Saccharothrix longispora]|uniref:DNA-binding protein YbaB n=1 Tax=Saccharothrix longispora TaxID=33920 RepID=A0ABU1Q0U2_9PSEU|nr:YbaB/EbfC family nucleoid-associated protein [Saccharothrix longispora]MDR6596507.1 DNA-binding protein YbaB [Saccharothrix longispora]
MDPERMIADLEAKARDLARRSREVRDGIGAATATACSPDGVVTVTVAPNGALRDIAFARSAGLSDERLGELVLATVRQAQAEVARRVADVVEPEFGGTEAMDFLTGFLPAGERVARVPLPPPAVRAEDVPDAAPDLPLPRSLRGTDDDGGTAPR